jgi:hypothetical protein
MQGSARVAEITIADSNLAIESAIVLALITQQVSVVPALLCPDDQSGN